MPIRRATVPLVLLLALSACFREDDENTNEGTDPTAGQAVVEVELRDDAISMPDEIPAGDVLFEVTNAGTTDHGFEIEGTDARLDSLAVDQMETVTASLEPGTYRAFSPVEGDRERGLEVQFTVVEGTGASGAPLFEEGVEPSEDESSGGEDQPGDGG